MLATQLSTTGAELRSIDIVISYDVVRLLSEQLYASPAKAIEELVVNSWDAEAHNCSVLVDAGQKLIAVFDDGNGMTEAELANLWHIGQSRKQGVTARRKQIGKFGIGKLASYAVARRATYVTKASDGVLSVSIDFDDLAARTDPETGIPRPLTLQIRKYPDVAALDELTAFSEATRALMVRESEEAKHERLCDLESEEHWTLVVLEDLRERGTKLSSARLKWILETAMPYSADFRLFLDGDRVVSSKRLRPAKVSFSVSEIASQRLEELELKTKASWRKDGDRLVSDFFPNGVTGKVVITENSLYQEGGKSEDLGRSHGFFVRVHNRLINETDPLFGARPLSFGYWYRFAAEVEADDLNPFITAARDDIEQSEVKDVLRTLLIALFNEARDRDEALVKAQNERRQNERLEEQREYVNRRLVEKALADALSLASRGPEVKGGPDRQEWTLVKADTTDAELEKLLGALYAEVGDAEHTRRSYTFRDAEMGENEPFTRFDPSTATVTLNTDHELVSEFADKPPGRRALELFAVAEALTEAYMREADLAPEFVREILARRDLLLRSLASDESNSLDALAREVVLASRRSSDSKAFEIAVVGALRALGFAAQHISGSKAPDGTAGYRVYGFRDKSITVETKASIGTPDLNAIDFAGIHSHYLAVGGSGAICVAPSFPGASDPQSEAHVRANNLKVSCWTAENLARVVEAAERRHITAHQVQEIILSKFGPLEVQASVEELLSPEYDRESLYREILNALESMADRLTDIPRNATMIATGISLSGSFPGVKHQEVVLALRELAAASKGFLHVTDAEDVVVRGDLNELRRRVSALTNSQETPRRRGTFRGAE